MRLLLSFLLILLASSFAAAQPKGGPLKPDDALKALKVADGFQVELFAAEPMLINPTRSTSTTRAASGSRRR